MRRGIRVCLIVIGSLSAIDTAPAHAQTRDTNQRGNYETRGQSPDESVDNAFEPGRGAGEYHRTRSQRRISGSPRASTNTGAETSDKTRAQASNLSTTFGALAIVVAVILVGGWILRRHNPLVMGGLPAEAVEVLGRRQVDPKQAILLVRLGSRLLVLGSSTQGLQTLAEVTEPVEVDYLAGVCRQRSSESSASQTFRALFSMRSATSRAGNRARTRASVAAEPPEWDATTAAESLEVRHG